MASRSFRNRLGESTNIWPGFVDVLATLLIVIIFVLMIFTVSQIYLSDAISGRDKALQELRIQISELSKILQSEVNEKVEALDTLSETKSLLSGVQSDLSQQELITEGLQTDLAKKSTEIFVQEQNILALSGQITELLSELRIVAKALEVYEGLDSAILDTEGLGEKINRALAARIDQLKTLNEKLDQTNNKLAISQTNLNEKITELYGRVTDFPFAIIYPLIDKNPRHPSQLYEAFFEGIILFIILLYYFSKKPQKFIIGNISGLFLIFYSIFRFLIEYLREPDFHLGLVFYYFSMGQLLCIPFLLAGIWILVRK
ncbi:prolipoprotein diacylglyceryl transferase [Pelagibacteraceae bacterium]|nr:prolipoprotein diacylglyceryl transferase [Pelagibacteraceae bacterium]